MKTKRAWLAFVGLFWSAVSLAGTEPAGSMSIARDWHVAVALSDGRVLVAGGYTPQGLATSAEIYDPATGTFTATAAMAVARGSPAGVRLADGRVLVIGGVGWDANGTLPLASSEIYDPATGTWTVSGSMALARRTPVAVSLPGGAVLVIGDSSEAGCEIFDPSTGAFTATGCLGTPRDDFAVSALQDGRVLVAGGRTPPNTYYASAELFDPATGTWSVTGSLSQARTGAVATPLGDGKVLVTGGTTSGTGYLAVTTTELFDPATGTFSAGAGMPVARAFHSASVLGDGNVVVTGGLGSSNTPIASINRYDVPTGTWRSAGSMYTARRRHSATLMGNGDVLLAGGMNSWLATLATAEIVDPACIVTPASLSPAGASFPIAGGSGSVSVTQVAGCSWKAAGNFTTWLTITSGAQGVGSGTVNYSVAANPDAATRSVTLSVAEVSFPVSQDGNPCGSATLSPTSRSFGSAGGNGSITLTASALCTWTVTDAPSWVTITSGGTGSATISYSVATNVGASRSAVLTIAGKSFTITQAANACFPAPTISPASRTFTSSGGTTTVAVTAPSTCGWTVTGKPAWITMSTSGTGNATLNVTASVNSGAERTSTFTVAGNSFTVTQAANPCLDATLSPANASHSNAAGTGSIALTAGASCTWNVTGIPSWITVTSGTSGSGNATIAYSVAANSGAARSATLMVAGRSFPVSQAQGACYPTPSINPTSASFTATAGTGTKTVNVTAPATCSWSVANVPAWLTVTSPMSGSGNGAVTYTIPANTGAARSGTMVIANINHSVTQSAPGTATLPTGRMVTPRSSFHGAALADGRMLVAGGYAGPVSYADATANAEIFDHASGTFSATGPLNQARASHRMVLLADGRMLALGGRSTTGQVLASAEIYDPVAGTWTLVSPMNVARSEPMLVRLADDRVLVIAGRDPGDSAIGSTEIFDPATGAFTPSGAMLTARVSAGFARLGDGRVLVAGGFGSGAHLASAELWDPVTGAWTSTGPMTVARGEAPAVALLSNGKVLVAGGYSSATYIAAAELYDPATGAFTATGALSYPRSNALPVVLVDGSVVVLGGVAGNRNVERYDATAGTWQVMGQYSDDRSREFAALAGNGKVLVAGGNPGPTPSAELFDPAICPTTATLSPTSASFAGGSGSGSIAVTLTAGCPRTVSAGRPSWITITSGGTGTGSGTVGYSVAANNGAARSATFSVAGASFTVSQAVGGAAACGFAGSIPVSQTVTGTLASGDCTAGARDSSYYTDRWSFEASPGQQVAFHLSSSAFDTYLYLKNPAGTVIASNDDGGGGTNSRIPATSGVFTLPAGAAGTYVIEVTSYGTFATGTYTLQRVQ